MRWIAWISAGMLMALGLAACGTTVAIQARYPARHAEAADIRRVVVGEFDGFGGPPFEAVMRQTLYDATFDGRPYFTVLSPGGGFDPGMAAAYGRAQGAQGVLFGTVRSQFDTDTYETTENRCVEWKDKQCVKHRDVPIPCWRRNIELIVQPTLVNAANGRVLYSTEKRSTRSVSWCANQKPPTGGDAELASGPQQEIATAIRRDIGPYNATLSAGLKTKGDGLAADQKAKFTAAVKAASGGDMDQACGIWSEIDRASPGNLDTVYDLGVCAESRGDYGRAIALYRKAQGLAPSPDRMITTSVGRAEQLRAAEAALARTKAGRR